MVIRREEGEVLLAHAIADRAIKLRERKAFCEAIAVKRKKKIGKRVLPAEGPL